MTIRRHLDQEIEDLRVLLEEMCQTTLNMLLSSIGNLYTADQAEFDRIFDLEVDVNRLQMKIDDLAWKIMALYQPTASDLRFLIGSIKAAVDLERVGDEVCVMCRRAMELHEEDFRIPPSDLTELEIMTRSVYKDGVSILLNPNEDLADIILSSDDTIDRALCDLFQKVLQNLHENPSQAESWLDFLAIGRSLERIADHATNLAEIAIFMLKGKDVRHKGMSFK